jgi:NADPH:quinone reductase-like Zn-dependent oxidoreductase
MDIGVRTGKFWPDKVPPFTLGVEGAGRVLGLGEGADKLRIGDRVAWFYVRGSYAQQIVAPADTLVPIPDVISDETAASLMMQGLTASHFVTEVYAIKPGDIALVHAAAGGVGLLLTQMIKLRGGMVIGRVSSASKVEVARAAGADHVIVESGGMFVEQVMRLTDGEGVHVCTTAAAEAPLLTRSGPCDIMVCSPTSVSSSAAWQPVRPCQPATQRTPHIPDSRRPRANARSPVEPFTAAIRLGGKRPA